MGSEVQNRYLRNDNRKIDLEKYNIEELDNSGIKSKNKSGNNYNSKNNNKVSEDNLLRVFNFVKSKRINEDNNLFKLNKYAS